MTVEEARIYFVATDKEDLQDEYREELFLNKNFFVTKTPITKVFLARLKKLKRIHEAFLILGGEEMPSEFEEVDVSYNSQDLGTAFRTYSKVRSVLNGKLMLTSNVVAIEKIVLNLLEATRRYAKVWEYQYDNFDGILASTGENDMLVLEELKRLEQEGAVTINRIQKLDDENILVRESKRLSLWLNLDVNV